MLDILLVDDLPEALAMLEAACQAAFPGACCTMASNVSEARQLLDTRRFAIALIDLGLPDGDGLDIIRHIQQHQPDCATVVATIFDDDAHLFKALQAGAQGYLLKDQAPEWLAQQLQKIFDGQPPLSPAIARRLLRYFQRPAPTEPILAAELTLRERAVLGLLAQGMRIVDIGNELDISRHTAGDHVKNIYRKLKINSRAEAALHAKGLGLI
ncbi:response regulator transcription factor [Rhodoferax sp.]|uniref:response regulator n=1 Tax=Rhodoferax sp. TaxID=50421 RepID=UPI00271B977E|nr:response regulator transcription factor [Rhodoferax sp.]MDO8318158.1 response regulator transcription factor [Rhodoferax sp.]MDP2677968.1 response regulator transcription factor [Rhodoferax sp.]